MNHRTWAMILFVCASLALVAGLIILNEWLAR